MTDLGWPFLGCCTVNPCGGSCGQGDWGAAMAPLGAAGVADGVNVGSAGSSSSSSSAGSSPTATSASSTTATSTASTTWTTAASSSSSSSTSTSTSTSFSVTQLPEPPIFLTIYSANVSPFTIITSQWTTSGSSEPFSTATLTSTSTPAPTSTSPGTETAAATALSSTKKNAMVIGGSVAGGVLLLLPLVV